MFRRTLIFLLLCASASAQPSKLPTGVILVPGATPSASDAVTPLPEGGSVANNVYRNAYFGLSYPLPQDWVEKYKGPPPSDNGMYVLAQLRATKKGTILITAQDLFFTIAPAANAKEMIRYAKDTLQSYYTVERQPEDVRIAGHSFTRFDYGSPVAGLHWYMLATEIRCHAVQFVFTARDSSMLDSIVKDMERLKLPDDGVVCVADYATGANVISKVDPVLTDNKFNPIPVRITIDAEGKVKHIHVISAFPDQAKVITDALKQWRFKPYMQNGGAVEVETGIMFGTAPPRKSAPAAGLAH